MAKKAVFCIAGNTSQANDIVERLRTAGFACEDISVLLPDKSGNADLAHKKATKAPEGATVGASSGAVLGGALGWLAGIGALAIPGLGPFIAAGPILAALSGAAVGGTVGGITGGLVGLGIPEFEAKKYEGKLREGNVLIAVHSENHDQVKRAKQIFEESDARDISTSSESSVKSERKAEEKHARKVVENRDRP